MTVDDDELRTMQGRKACEGKQHKMVCCRRDGQSYTVARGEREGGGGGGGGGGVREGGRGRRSYLASCLPSSRATTA